MSSDANAVRPEQMCAPPVVEGVWVRPAAEAPALPVWGCRDGLRIGVPLGNRPAGILRVYHEPVIGNASRVINFIAVEPVVEGRRGLSELEASSLDSRQGKRMWSGDEPSFIPGNPLEPARGRLVREQGRELLQVFVMVEAFDNGTRPYLRLTFDALRPDEVRIETFAAPGGAAMSACIVTATMGNYARLRQLWLKDRMVTSRELWPDYRGNDFAPHVAFGLGELWRDAAGGALVAATPDEECPWEATAPGGWHYRSRNVATQYWRLEPEQVCTGTLARVNGRYVYWAGTHPIPGGISYENLELERPFRHGEASIFGVTTQTVSRLRESVGSRAGR